MLCCITTLDTDARLANLSVRRGPWLVVPQSTGVFVAIPGPPANSTHLAHRGDQLGGWLSARATRTAVCRAAAVHVLALRGAWIKNMWLKLWKLVHKQKPPPPEYTTCSTSPGDLEGLPDTCYSVWLPQLDVQHAVTGPGSGVAELQEVFGDLDIGWETQDDSPVTHTEPAVGGAVNGTAARRSCGNSGAPSSQLWGYATSLYDIDPTTGRPAGEPVADFYAGVQLPGGCSLLAVADGVNWGERPRRAARAAVYGVVRHVLVQLLHRHQASRVDTNQVLSVMRQAISTAQRLIISSEGTLTTLVASLVAPVDSPDRSHRPGATEAKQQQPPTLASHHLRRSAAGGRAAGGAADAAVQAPQFVVCTMAIGDSAAYVWRQRAGVVEELTAAGRYGDEGGHRDPRICPGALGYAMGEHPDLTNLTLSVTHIAAGDVVYLTSDGIADNFDPVVAKRAVASTTHLPGVSYSPASSVCDLNGGGDPEHLVTVTPAESHQLSLDAMASLLNHLWDSAATEGPLGPAAASGVVTAVGDAGGAPTGAGAQGNEKVGLEGGSGITALSQERPQNSRELRQKSSFAHGLSKLCLGIDAEQVDAPGHNSHISRNSNGSCTAAASFSSRLVSSQQVGRSLLDYVQQLTAPHRALIEERSKQLVALQAQQHEQVQERLAQAAACQLAGVPTDLSYGSMSSMAGEEQFLVSLANIPGKLDHATVLAFTAHAN